MTPEQLLHKTVTLVSSLDVPFAHRMSWHVVAIRRVPHGPITLSLVSPKGMHNESVHWVRLKEWIREGYVHVSE